MTDFAITSIEISGFVISVRYLYSIHRNGIIDKVIVNKFLLKYLSRNFTVCISVGIHHGCVD
jgi:peptidoglycan/LPS O-acetylase OafA/YrhL